MPYAEPLSEEELAGALVSLPGWSAAEGRLERTFAFASFMEAVGFVSRVAELAEKQDHHPDIDLRYRKVTLRLVTWAAGGRITERDVRLARAVSEPAPASGAEPTG